MVYKRDYFVNIENKYSKCSFKNYLHKKATLFALRIYGANKIYLQNKIKQSSNNRALHLGVAKL